MLTPSARPFRRLARHAILGALPLILTSAALGQTASGAAQSPTAAPSATNAASAPPAASAPVVTGSAPATVSNPNTPSADSVSGATPPTPSAPVSPPPATNAVAPAPVDAVAYDDSPDLPAAATGAIRTLLLRLAPKPMGQNDAVSLWVRGAAPGAMIRIRLIQSPGDSPASDTLDLVPNWLSDFIPLSWTSWHKVIIPKRYFKLKIPAGAKAGVDLALPADAQPDAPIDPPSPKWADINAIVIELSVPKTLTVNVDDIAWATLDSQDNPTDSVIVDDFEKGNVAAWTPLGLDAQRTSAVYSVATGLNQAHSGRVGFKIAVTAPNVIRDTIQLPAAIRAMLASHKSYLVFTPPSTFAPVLPSTLPDAGTSSSQVTIQVCPEQIQAASFCVYTRHAWRNVTVSLSDDLHSVGNTFPRSAINLHVVKVWKQLGSGELRDMNMATLAPELLVKDDRIDLSGIAPAIPLTGNVTTDIPADTTKQFWLTVNVPRNQAPGNYTGTIRVAPAGLPPVPVRVNLSVLPLRLMSPSKQYAIHLRSRLDSPPSTLPSADGSTLVTDFVTPSVLSAQLVDIASHGIRFSSVDDSATTLPIALPLYTGAGIAEPLIYDGPSDPRDVEAARAGKTRQPLLYYVKPEPNDSAKARIDAVARQSALALTLVPRQSDYDALQDGATVVAYQRDADYPQQLLRTHGNRTSSKRDWWYWSATDEAPAVNRLSAGYLLCRANLYGAFLPEYQEAFGADPYDETSAGAPASRAAYRPLMLTYPARDGVIDTLQWEAVREGINDVRYLTTFYAALRECKDAHIAKPLVTEAETYATTFLSQSLPVLPESEFDKARAKISDYALKLRTTVDAYNKKNHISD